MEFLHKMSAWIQTVWASPFQRGVCCGVAAILLLWLLWKILKLVWFLSFGPRRCRFILVPGKGGEISIAADAVSDAVLTLLKPFDGLDVIRLSLYRRSRGYQLELRCHYHAAKEIPGIPALSEKVKPLLIRRLDELFGIRNLSRIVIRVESFDGPAGELPPETPEMSDSGKETPAP